jgi:hypothetical protein
MNKGWIISDLGTFNFLYKDSLQMNKLNNGMHWSDFTFFLIKKFFHFII